MTSSAGHSLAMLSELYIEALLVDEDAADQIWEAWNTQAWNDAVACMPGCSLLYRIE